MGSRKTIGVMNREKTRSRRATAKANGLCTICFVTPAETKTLCPAGKPGGNWCSSAPPHEHAEVPTARCRTCRLKRAKGKEEAPAE